MADSGGPSAHGRWAGGASPPLCLSVCLVSSVYIDILLCQRRRLCYKVGVSLSGCGMHAFVDNVQTPTRRTSSPHAGDTPRAAVVPTVSQLLWL